MHLGPLVTALVDGELALDVRERALDHVRHCADCQAKLDAERRVKQRVASGDLPAPTGELTRRLLALAADAPVPVDRGTRSARRGTLLAGAGALSLGGGAALTAAFLLGGAAPAASPDLVPGPALVVPPVDVLTVEHVGTEAGLPLGDPAGQAAVPPLRYPATLATSGPYLPPAVPAVAGQ